MSDIPPTRPMETPSTGKKKPRNRWIASTVAFAVLFAVCLTGMIDFGEIAAHKGAFAASKPGPVHTVVVTKTNTVTDTSNSDALQSQLDGCSTAFHQLADVGVKENDLFSQTTSIAADAVDAAAIGDTATLDSDTAQLNDINTQVQSITDDIDGIDGSFCQ